MKKRMGQRKRTKGTKGTKASPHLPPRSRGCLAEAGAHRILAQGVGFSDATSLKRGRGDSLHKAAGRRREPDRSVAIVSHLYTIVDRGACGKRGTENRLAETDMWLTNG